MWTIINNNMYPELFISGSMDSKNSFLRHDFKLNLGLSNLIVKAKNVLNIATKSVKKVN